MIREFRCEKCGWSQERIVSKREDELTLKLRCPNCEAFTAKKVEVSRTAPPIVKGGTPKFYTGGCVGGKCGVKG